MKLSQNDIEYLIKSVDAALKKIIDLYHTDFNISIKKDQSPLTQADVEANKILIAALQARWPDIPILSEESEFCENQFNNPIYWSLDPLDGSKEFISRNGEFTINLALIKQGESTFGIVAAPALELIWIGCIGHSHQAKMRTRGAWSQLKTLDSQLNWANRNCHLRVAVSRSHPSEMLKDWLKEYPNHSLIELGSSLKIYLVAQGQIDCYPRFGTTCFWDIAAAHSVLKAIGGDIWRWPISNHRTLTYDLNQNYFNPFFIAALTCSQIRA